ncbi:MAG: hypothetical protein P8Q43_08920, partial [Ulvibacter sp.]|nr:hypothetical protein [Ulvibacter sp.]
MQKALVFLLFIASSIPAISQQINPLLAQDDQVNQQIWVDSVYSNMSLEQKVGQLFMVDVFSKDPKAKTDKIK